MDSDWVFKIFLGVIGLLVAFLVGLAVYGLYRVICFRSLYGEPHSAEGQVTNMKYEAPYTTYTTQVVGKVTTTTPHYHPAKNKVYISIPEFNLYYDSDVLYQRVRIGEKVTVSFQKEFVEPRFWKGKIEPNGIHTLAIDCYNDQRVVFNKEKKVSAKVSSRDFVGKTQPNWE